MKRGIALFLSVGLPLLIANLALLPPEALAVVSDVTLTGLPPNTTVTLTNDTTGEKTEGKTDEKGDVIIVLTGRNWESGTCTVTIREPEGKTISEKIALKDGSNRIDLSHIARTAPPKTKPKKEFRLSDPIRTPIPESGGAGEVATGIAKGLVGGLLGGLFGGGGRQSDGPSLPLRPPYPEQTFTSKDGKTKVNLSGATDPDACQIVVGGIESPGNGAPHLVVLQDNKGNVLQPTGITVYQIWEVWGGWRVTVSWTKSYFEDGRLVKQEHGGWSTSWTEFLGRFKSPGDIPAIWKDFGGKPFEGIRGIIADFKLPEGQTFNMPDWNLVAHITTKEGNFILTQPFVAGMTAGEKGLLSFTQREQTVYEAMLP